MESNKLAQERLRKTLLFLHSYSRYYNISRLSFLSIFSNDDVLLKHKYNRGNIYNQRSISSSPFQCHLLPPSVPTYSPIPPRVEDVFLPLRLTTAPVCKNHCFSRTLLLCLSLLSCINVSLSAPSFLSADNDASNLSFHKIFFLDLTFLIHLLPHSPFFSLGNLRQSVTYVYPFHLLTQSLLNPFSLGFDPDHAL